MTFDSDQGQAFNREAQALLPSGLISAALTDALMRDPNPAMILATDGRTPLWSSHEAARRFGYRDAQSLMRARLPATAPGTQRLEQIGAERLEAATPRLERLRYFIGFRGMVLTVLCHAIPLVGGRNGILVAFPVAKAPDIGSPHLGLAPTKLGSESSETEKAVLDSAEDDEIDVNQPDFFERELTMRPASDLIRQARAMLGKGQEPASQEPATQEFGLQQTGLQVRQPEEPKSLGPLASAMPIVEPLTAAPFGPSSLLEPALTRVHEQTNIPQVTLPPSKHGHHPLPPRFLFVLDAPGRLTRDVLDLGGLVGADQLVAGASLADVLDEIDPDAAEAIRAGVMSGETWQPISLDWPYQDGRGDVSVRLTALPLIDAARGLTGFSGFGRINRATPISLDDAVATPSLETKSTSGASVLGPLAVAGLAGGAMGWSEADEALTTDEATETLSEDEIPEATLIADEDAEAAGLIEDDESADNSAHDHSEHGLSVENDVIHGVQADAVTAQGLPAGEFDTAAWRDKALDFGKATALNAIEDATLPPSTEDIKAAAAQATPLLSDEHDLDTDSDSADDADAGSSPKSESDERPFDTAEFASRITPFPLPGGRRKDDTPGAQNVVSIHNGQPSPAMPGFQRQGLSMSEKNAFREIARALGARFAGGDETESITSPLTATGARAVDNAANLEHETAAKPVSANQPDQIDREQDNIAGGPNPHFGLGDGVAGFLDRLPLGLMVLKGEQPLFVNRTLLDLTAYPDFASFVRENGARAIFRKGIAPREESRMPDPMVLATRDGEMVPVDAQLQLVDWDGAPATLISVRRAVELEQGKALRTVAMDLKRARADSDELRAILDTATDGVLTLDASGQVLSMNGTAQALFGLHQNEIVGEHFTRLLANESHAIAMDYLDGLKLGGVRSVLNDGREVQGCEKNGGEMPLFMTLGRISADDPPRFCAVLRDITAWKRAETDLTEARRVAESASAKKSDFLAKISHEIRTPMNAIIGFSEVMQEERLGPLGTPKYKEYLTDIRTSGQHVVSLVNDLLDLAKIEAGRMELDFQATDLNAIVQSAVQIIQPQANTARVLVRSQLAQKLPPVVADERSVRQIVLNILSNATRFTEGGGQVIVSTSLLEGGEAVIRIRDTGIGMSGPEIEQALEPFRQVGQKRNKGGTGLGLPLTKALVEANRANFAIRSHPGEGTLVEVAFPSTRVLAE